MRYDRGDVRNFLESKGFSRLGGGAFSTVMAHPKSDRVVKLGGNDNWLGYCLWAAEKGYAGNFAPKVHSYRVTPSGTQYIAIVERAAYTIDRLLCSGSRAYKYADQFRSFVFECHRTARRGQPIKDKLSPMTASAYPGLEQFGIDLATWAANQVKQDGYNLLDLNDGNIMFRKDGSMVITDPITSELSREVPQRMRSLELEALSLMATVSDVFA